MYFMYLSEFVVHCRKRVFSWLGTAISNLAISKKENFKIPLNF